MSEPRCIVIAGPNGAGKTTFAREYLPHHSITIPTLQPKGLFERFGIPYYLKMDIEGMEYEALFSCPTEDLQTVERVALEYHDDLVYTSHQVPELVAFLNTSGFSTQLFPRRRILVARPTPH